MSLSYWKIQGISSDRREDQAQKESGEPPLKAQIWVEFEELWGILEGDRWGMQAVISALRLLKDNWVTHTLRTFPRFYCSTFGIFQEGNEELNCFVFAFGCASEFNNMLK